jgi:hypothetical protein
MLGDAYAHKNEDAIRIEHGYMQADYAKWKQNVLSGLGAYVFCTDRTAADSSIVVKRSGKNQINAIAVQVGIPYVTKWARRLFYTGGKKTVTNTWLEKLNLFGFCVWFLDDGSMNYEPSRSRFVTQIATNSFNKEELEMLVRWLKEHIGVTFTVTKDSRLFAHGREAAHTVMDIVAAHVPWAVIPKSKVALRKHCKQFQETKTIKPLQVINTLGQVPVEITGITPYTHDKPDVAFTNVYDFTVQETHSYCASSVLVSNSKRQSGLETGSMLSAGAYAMLRENATLRGQKNDSFWQSFRSGQSVRPPGSPFVWDKFQALVSGTGLLARKLPKKGFRIGPITDRELDRLGAVEIQNGDMVHPESLEPVQGGLFDRSLVGNNKYGYIRLPEAIPNPAMEPAILKLLGLTKTQYREILAGRAEL